MLSAQQLSRMYLHDDLVGTMFLGKRGEGRRPAWIIRVCKGSWQWQRYHSFMPEKVHLEGLSKAWVKLWLQGVTEEMAFKLSFKDK